MADLEREQTSLEEKSRTGSASDEAEDDDDDADSPFDHPYFLPALIWALALWFGYDGWLNQDPDMQEHLAFNRWGFAVLVVAGTYFTVQAIRERRAESEAGARDAGSPGS